VEYAGEFFSTFVVGGTECTASTAAIVPTLLVATIWFAGRGQIVIDLGVDIQHRDIIDDILRGWQASKVHATGRAILDNDPDSAVLFGNLAGQHRFEGAVLILSALLFPGILADL